MACQRPAPEPLAAPEPPAAPPPRALTICERPPQPAATGQDPKVEASFRTFARTHLEKLRKAGAAKSKQIRDEFETELRPTGNKQAPWVGLLRYCERAPSKSTVVTEIFRFQGGKWIY